MKKFFKKVLLWIWLVSLVVNWIPLNVNAETRLNKSIEERLVNDSLKKEDEVVEEELLADSEVEAIIVEEIEEKRGEYEKHYLMSDGTMMASLYSDEIHYEENGEYIEYDHELVETNGRYKPNKNKADISFSKKADSKGLLEIKNKNKTVKMGLKDSVSSVGEIEALEEVSEVSIFDFTLKNYNNKISKVNNGKGKIKYNEVGNGIDIEYEVIPTGIKENIIIKNKGHLKTTFEYNFDTNGLIIEQIDDNYIVLKDINGEVIFHISAPYMYDAKFASSDKIKMTLKDNNLKLELDEGWLKNKERVFPIVIDPTVTTEQSNKTLNDTIIHQGDGSDSSSFRRGRNILYLGSNNWAMFSGNPVRVIEKFPNLPSLSSTDQVISATYHIKSYPMHPAPYVSEAIQFNIHKITTNWEWGTGDNWNTLSGTDKYSSRVSDYFIYQYTSNDPEYVYTADITNMVQEWYTEGKNYGFMIKEATETYMKNRSLADFYSASNTSTYCPKMTINYINQSGLEGYLNYHEQSIGRTTTYTNDFNGNLVLIHADASTPGNRFPVSINHVYNTGDIRLTETNNVFGVGFRLNLSQTLKVDELGRIVFKDDDGTNHYFNKEGSEYLDESNLGLKITASGTDYIMKDKDGNTSKFTKYNSIWYLTEIKDTSNNKITITLDTTNPYKILSVKDAVGDTLTLTYNGNLLSSIKNTAGLTTSYSYTNGNLTKITYPDSKVTSYNYINNKLTEVINIDNAKVKYDYYDGISLSRVSKITEFGTDGEPGNHLNISYGQKVTTFKDNKGFINTETFTNYGTLVSVSDFENENLNENVLGASTKYGATGGSKNRLTASTNLKKTTSNYLINHNFEDDSKWTTARWIGTGGNTVYDTVEKYYGNRSAKLIGAIDTDLVSHYLATVPKGKTYTLSGYIKTTGLSGAGVSSIGVRYNDANNNFVYEEVSVKENKDWTRYSVTFNYPTNAKSALTIYLRTINNVGNTYFDNLQLEESEVSNDYNFIQNGNFFHGDTLWSKTVTTSSDTVATVNDNKMFKFVGEAAKRKNIYQNIDISGNKDDTFSLSFWYKNLGIINYHPESTFTDIRINFVDTNGKNNWVESPGLNPDASAWQYENFVFKATVDYKKIVVYLCFYNQLNEYYIDNISLIKDISGNSFAYDNNGNLINTNNQTKKADVFVNNANSQLTNGISTTGSNFSYEYDYNIKNRLLKTTNNNTNVEYNLEYDTYGNNTALTIESNNKNVTPKNGTFYIKSALSGLTIDTTNNPANGVNVYQWAFWGLPSSRLKLTEVETGYYKIESTHVLTKAFTVNSSNSLILADYIGNDDQKWKFNSNPDGSYYIVSKSGKAISIKNDKTEYGAPYEATTYIGKASQKFFLYDIDKETTFTNQVFESGSMYRIKNKASGLYLGYKNINVTDYVVQKKLDEADLYQLWRIVRRGDREYYLLPIGSQNGKTLCVQDGIDVDNRATHIFPSDESYPDCRWYLNELDEKRFQIVSPVGANRTITIENGSKAVDAKAVIKKAIDASSDFYIEEVLPYTIEDGIYYIKAGEFYLGSSNSSSPTSSRILLRTLNENSLQKWQITNLNNGYYNITALGTNLNIDIANAGTANGTIVNLWHKGTSPAQQFEFVRNVDGTYKIKPRHAKGLASLDVKSASFVSNNEIQLYESHNGVAQNFTFQRIDSNNNSKIETKASYSPNGNYMTASTDQRGNNTAYSYNTTKGTLSSVTNAKNVGTSYQYDTMNRITSVTTGNKTNTYTYENDYLKSITHNGINYNFSYNRYGRLVKVNLNNQVLITNDYEGNGNLLSSTYGNENIIKYEYDSLNRLSKKITNTNNYNYSYNNDNRLAVKKDNVGNIDKYTYDLAGRITEYKYNSNYVGTYKYDNRNNLSEITNNLGTTLNGMKYYYDNDSKQVSYNLNKKMTIYNYDKFGRLSTKELGTTNTFKTTYSYVKAGDKETTLVSSVVNKNDELKYEYDVLGNISKEYYNNVLSNEYKYDNLNQLIEDKDYLKDEVTTYTYDSGGNILTKVMKKLSNNVIIGTSTYSYGNSNWKDQLTNYNGNNITYDNIGNPLTIGNNIAMSWQNGRELSRYQDASKKLDVTYKYNDNGIRTSKIINGVEHNYYLEGNKIIYETFGNNTIYYFYDANGNIEGLRHNNKYYYYVKNLQGDVIGLLDETGNKIVSYEYDAWGKVLSVKDETNSQSGFNVISKQGLSTPRTDTSFWGSLSAYVTPKSNGWSKVYFDNTNGSAVTYINMMPKLSAVNIKPNTQYTVIIETKNINSKQVNGLVLMQTNQSDDPFTGSTNASVSLSELKSGIIKKLITSKADFKNVVYGLRMFTMANAGAITEFELRVTLVEGDYTNTDYTYESFNGVNLITNKGLSTPKTDTSFWNATSTGFTPLADGWGRYQGDNRSGTANLYINSFIKLSAVDIKPNKTYTAIIEFRNVGSDNSGNFNFTSIYGDNDAFSKGNSVGIESIQNGTIIKRLITTKAEFTNVTIAMRTFSTVPPGKVSNFEARIVLVEGDYTNVSTNYEFLSRNEITDQNHIGMINPIRYRGYYYDTETQLYYLNSRYYNPEMGRFLNIDRLLGANQDMLGYNLYAYASNNPIMYADPSGEGIILTCIIVGAIAGLLAGGTYGAVKSKAETGKVDATTVIKHAGLGALGGAAIGAGVGVLGNAASALLNPATPQIVEKGFEKFSQLKNHIGSAGYGNEWHHIVEQSQKIKSGFDSFMINNTKNIIAVSQEVHRRISGYYSSIPIEGFTNGLRFRDWLAGQNWQTQYDWGMRVIEMFKK